MKLLMNRIIERGLSLSASPTMGRMSFCLLPIAIGRRSRIYLKNCSILSNGSQIPTSVIGAGKF